MRGLVFPGGFPFLRPHWRQRDPITAFSWNESELNIHTVEEGC